MATANEPTAPDLEPVPMPTTQGPAPIDWGPTWMREMPQFFGFRPKEPQPDYQLIDRARLEKLLANYNAETREQILADLDYAEYDLLRLFRERDWAASYHQNRYRVVQIVYTLLAALATGRLR